MTQEARGRIPPSKPPPVRTVDQRVVDALNRQLDRTERQLERAVQRGARRGVRVVDGHEVHAWGMTTQQVAEGLEAAGITRRPNACRQCHSDDTEISWLGLCDWCQELHDVNRQLGPRTPDTPRWTTRLGRWLRRVLY